MSSAEAPVVTVRVPLTPRLVELLSGEWRYVPILTAIALIWIFFGAMDPKFLSPRNLSNLSLQSIVTGTLALGLAPVLIIRQIDMSVAAVSGVAATITGQLLLVFDTSVWLAIAAGVLFGVAVGFLQARWITRTRAPGFLVTFGVSLILAAAQLLLPRTGQINLFGTDLTFLAGLRPQIPELGACGARRRRFRSFPLPFGLRRDKGRASRHRREECRGPDAGRAVGRRGRGGRSERAQRGPRRATSVHPRHHRPVVCRLAYSVWDLSIRGWLQSKRGGSRWHQGRPDPHRRFHDLRRIRSFRRHSGRFPPSRRNRRAWARRCSKRSRPPWWEARAFSAAEARLGSALLGALAITSISNGIDRLGLGTEVKLADARHRPYPCDLDRLCRPQFLERPFGRGMSTARGRRRDPNLKPIEDERK